MILRRELTGGLFRLDDTDDNVAEEVVNVLDEAWEMVKPIASKYYH